MFAAMLAVFTRTVFHQETDYYDDNVSPFYTFNYLSFSSSFYSGFLTGLMGTATYEGIMRYYESDWVKCFFWVFIFLLIKLLISNFLVGALYVKYLSLFEEEVQYIN